MSSDGDHLRPGRTWLSLSGIFLEPDPQRTRKADQGRAFAHQSAAVDGVRSKFDVVDARDWLREAPDVEHVRAVVAFLRNDGTVPQLEVGRRTPAKDVTLTVAIDHVASLTQRQADIQAAILAGLLEGFDVISRRYRIGPFPESGVFKAGGRYAIDGKLLLNDPRVGKPTTTPHRSRNSIGYF
jgi:hypothetical protein